MYKWFAGGLVAAAAVSVPALAQEWRGAGPIVASFYNEEMSVPKGWELTYSGTENGVEVYTFIVRPENAGVDTSWIDADSQLQRLFCGDDDLRGWVTAGMKARADKVVVRDGRQSRTKGSKLLTCPR
ncbi:MAG: hypothetical protein GW855_01285 [Erythrobacter sp.]|nr:hypothetical protein [Erythrobacter sp.]